MQAVALAARQHAALLLLIGAREIEPGHVSAGIDLAVAQHNQVGTLRNHLVNGFFRVDGLVLLIHVGQFDRLTDSESSRSRLFESHDHPEEGSLARTVGADHTDDTGRRQREVQSLVQHPVAEGFRYVVRLDHHIAQTRAVRDEYFELFLLLFGIFVHQLVIGRQTGFRLGVTSGGGHTHPLQLAFEGLATLRFLLLLHSHTGRLLLQPARIVTFPGNTFAAVEFQNPAGHVIQEIAVVRHGDHRALILLQVLLQPVDRLGVEVVGRLVQQQDVRLLQKQAAQGHAAAFAAREYLDALIRVGTAQGIHRTLQYAVQLPAVHVVDLFVQFALTLDKSGHLFVVHRLAEFLVDLLVLLQQGYGRGAALFDHFAHGLGIVEFGFLFQVTDRITGREDHFTLEILVDTRDDLHQSRFTRAVQTDDTDLGAVEEREVDVVENFFLVGEGLAYADHRKDDFFVCHIFLFELFAELHRNNAGRATSQPVSTCPKRDLSGSESIWEQR